MDKLIGSLAAVGTFSMLIFISVIIRMVTHWQPGRPFTDFELVFNLAISAAVFIMTKRYFKALPPTRRAAAAQDQDSGQRGNSERAYFPSDRSNNLSNRVLHIQNLGGTITRREVFWLALILCGDCRGRTSDNALL
jgi:hypothetical protein